MKKAKYSQKRRIKHTRSKTHKIKASYAHRKKHHKPFRARHIGLTLAALLIAFASVFQLGAYYGKANNPVTPVTNDVNVKQRVTTLKSSYGFSFAYDNELLSADATEETDTGVATVSESELQAKRPIISVTLRGEASAIAARDGAAQLSLRLDQDIAAFKTARGAAPATLSDEQVAAGMFEVSSDENFDINVVTQTNETLNGLKTIKRVHQYTPKFGNGNSRVYSVQWVGVLNGRAFAIHLQGLVGDTSVPSAFQPVFDTLNFLPADSDEAVLGLASQAAFLGFGSAEAQQLADDYIIDSISPAVVKIYHATCGTLIAFGQQLGAEACNLTTGSGFFISSDGYVATNGHVVDFSAEDAFVNILLSNPQTLVAFLQNIVGLNEQQINSLSQNPPLLATLITEIYELSDDAVTFSNESHTYFVAIGEEPLQVASQEEAYRLRSKVDSDTLVKAKLIDTDYSSKDLYVINSGDEVGFSSSDVALLKVPIKDSPFVRLFSGIVTQNMEISIVGFPGDAENLLTDNTKLSTSVTNGSISAIRDSAGGKYKLYQSDADASGGNSGGPALSATGEALGLITYRFKNNVQQDAAKTYIRAIADLKTLADDNDISLSQDGTVQKDWETGLDLYSQNKFSMAIKEFEKVEEAFPAHRLSSTYITHAKQAIAEGRDVAEFPVIVLIGGTIALTGVGGGIILIARHHGHHQKYKLSQRGKAMLASAPLHN